MVRGKQFHSFIELIYIPYTCPCKLKSGTEGKVRKRREPEGCFSFPIADFLPLRPNATAEEVIISFSSTVHKHQSRNAS